MLIKWNYRDLTYATSLQMAANVRGLIKEGKRPSSVELFKEDLGTLLGQLEDNPQIALEYIQDLYTCLAVRK